MFEAGWAGRYLEEIFDGSLNLSRRAIRCFRHGVRDGILELSIMMEGKREGAVRNDSRHDYARNQCS